MGGVKSIDTLQGTVVALKEDGTVWAWGSNNYGEIGDNTTVDRNVPTQVLNLNSITAIASGGDHSAALQSDGTVWTWGANHSGQLGHSYGSYEMTPDRVRELGTSKAIACGWLHTLALNEDGTVWAWGRNDDGQLGDGTTENRDRPILVLGLTEIVQIAAGFNFSAALDTHGDIWLWGGNSAGQLGNGTQISSPIPRRVTGIENVIRIQAGWAFFLALKDDGTFWTWGSNSRGQLGYETTGYYGLLPAQASDQSGTGELSLYNPSAALPSAVIDVSATPILEGESATLFWTSVNADSVSISPDIGDVAPGGSVEISPGETTTYTISASGAQGTAADQVTIAVIPKPLISFSASSAVINQGESAVLTWSTSYADTVQIDQGVGSVNASGSTLVSPTMITTYTLTATGPAGISEASVTLNVRVPRQTVIQYEYDELGRIRRKTFTNQ